MRKLNKIGLSLVLGSALAATAGAQGIDGELPTPEDPPTRTGTRGGNFLHLLVGARANAMGGAVSTSIAGPSAWFLNPAGAATSEGFSVAAGRQNLYRDLDLQQHYAAASIPVLGGILGLGVNTLSSGDIDRTTETAPFGDVALGRTFTWTSTAVSGGYARRLTDRLTVGGQLKFISEGIPDASTSWVAFDVGTQFATGLYGFTVSGAIQQIGPGAQATGSLISRQVTTPDIGPQNTRFELDTRETELPTAFRFALGSELLGSPNALLGNRGNGMHQLHLEATMNDAVDLPPQIGVGGEYGMRNMFFVRAGKRFFNDERANGEKGRYGLSGGFGLRIPVAGRDARFDYSFTSLGDLQDIQVFSIELGR